MLLLSFFLRDVFINLSILEVAKRRQEVCRFWSLLELPRLSLNISRPIFYLNNVIRRFCAVIFFFFLEITSFRPEKPLEFRWRPFFFFWDHLFSAGKIVFNLLQNWFGRKIWVKFLSDTLRVGHGKFLESKWATVIKRLGGTGLWRYFYEKLVVTSLWLRH